MRIGSDHSVPPAATHKRTGNVKEGDGGDGSFYHALLRAGIARGDAELTTYTRDGRIFITDQPNARSPSGYSRHKIARLLVREEPVPPADTQWLRQMDPPLFGYTQDIVSIHRFMNQTWNDYNTTPAARQRVIELLSPLLETLWGPLPEAEDALWDALRDFSYQYDQPDFRQHLLENAPVYKRSFAHPRVEEI